MDASAPSRLGSTDLSKRALARLALSTSRAAKPRRRRLLPLPHPWCRRSAGNGPADGGAPKLGELQTRSRVPAGQGRDGLALRSARRPRKRTPSRRGPAPATAI